MGLQRILWGYSECQLGLLYPGPLPGLGLSLKSLSPALVINDAILARQNYTKTCQNLQFQR